MQGVDYASELRRREYARSSQKRAVLPRHHMQPAPVPPEETAGSGEADLHQEPRESQPPVLVAASALTEVVLRSRMQSATIQLHLPAAATATSVVSPRSH